MNSHLTPIETAYLGHRFRSRLEARWAVAFETMGIAWHYEREAFSLPGGTGYMPDFYLPEMKLWVEVKPAGGDATKLETFALALAGTGERATVLREIPRKHLALCYHDKGENLGPLCWISTEREPEVHCDGPYMFCICDVCGKVGFTFQGRPRRIGCCHVDEPDRAGRGGDHPVVISAFIAARSFRFEPQPGDRPQTFRRIGDLIQRRRG